ncbi:MAG TPA: 16S rRNA (cytosine(1402)-N(4))-methyltransferase RsmH [Acidimicrobiales bacterium]|nr:16S rRNA (cytosine(1402)-N(4))-methyltransferase RsmH [Acidimicrobiales bacterium]
MCSSSTGALEGHSTHFRCGRLDLHLPLDQPAEGLQMAHSFEHIPVLRDEVVSLFAPVPPGVVVDATVGGGGHAEALLDAYREMRVVGLDRDPAALAAARARLSSFGDRITLVRSPFSALESVLEEIGLGPGGEALAGVLFDLGVSSPQLDVPERGFSFRSDGPLDMRMDPSAPVTAADLVNQMPEDALAALFRENGEGRLGGRIARAVVGARPLSSTGQLAEVVASAVPAAARRRGHPARRVFQALRIAVNDELGQLAAALPAALSRLSVGAVCAVISYHSGEDRFVKGVFADAATGGCVCPPGLPCVCGAVPRHSLVFRGSRKPSAAEVAANRRAEAARLRAIVRTEADPD